MAQSKAFRTEIAQLREGARQAQALADSLVDPAAKWGFADLAAKWDAEANALEAEMPD